MFVFLLVISVVAAEYQNDTEVDQIILFKEKTRGPIGIMTTSAGAPVEYKEATVTLNSKLIFNEYFMDSLTHLVRERIPERVVHAKGAGAFGYFEVTHDITHICKAKLFSKVGKRTPVGARFSLALAEKGGIDTSRDLRGFAVKFYTEDGNFDIVGLSSPMFAIKDPILFPTFARAQKRNPATNLMDPNMLWDFSTEQPESLYMFMLVFGDRGIPASYNHMPGFGIHTFEVVNDKGERSFVRFHFYPDDGIKNLSSEEARKIAGIDPDYATRHMYRSIANGKYFGWSLDIQILSLEDVKAALDGGFDVFDPTKVLPLNKYPLHPVGRLVLDRNPVNYFAEIEQMALNPSNLVPGILGSPDKLFEARRLSYRDAQYYRLGANFNKIRVNCPIKQVLTYNRDGRPPVVDNEKDIPNYYPNSFNGPIPYIDKDRTPLLEVYQDEPNNFDLATYLYTEEMSADERTRLINNIVYSLAPAADFLKKRAVKYFTIIHPDFGSRVEEGLQSNATKHYYAIH